MSELKLPAASGGGSISIKGPSSSGSDVDLLDTSGNLKPSGQMYLNDDKKLIVGTGGDMEIYHLSDQNYIYSGNGRINLRASEVRCENAAGNEVLAKFIADGACELRYNDSAKLTTIDTGVNITGGIRLGGNNAVNEIDDYEEGTFTPKLGGNANNSTYNVSGTGAYTKIGNVVHMTVRFHGVDLDNNADGCAIIYDLPFTGSYGNANNSVAGVTSDHITYNIVFSDDQRYVWYVSHNTSYWQGRIVRTNNSWADWDIDDFNAQNVLYIDFSGTYRTT